jgi:hypothetical protein
MLKETYRDQVRLHVLPAIEHFTLGEITTGRVEWFGQVRGGRLALAGQAVTHDAQSAVRVRSPPRRDLA